ncbi:MAG: hypothetical protein H6993_07660 [Pseudomonadales bacterium]|nr:hypothetical protein [Pseudomonadales bacterium]MCP5183823.1 hypothetical protein [Pseudomonadales bacterium]
MVWLMLIAAAVLVIGPVLYILPSQRDRQRADMRATARQQGLVVELAHVYDVDSPLHERVSASGVARRPELACVRYGLPLGKPLTGVTDLRLVRGRGGDWGHEPGVAASPLLERAVQASLGTLPPDTRGLVVSSSVVWLYWQEVVSEGTSPQATVEAVAVSLRGLRDRVVAAWSPPEEF